MSQQETIEINGRTFIIADNGFLRLEDSDNPDNETTNKTIRESKQNFHGIESFSGDLTMTGNIITAGTGLEYWYKGVYVKIDGGATCDLSSTIDRDPLVSDTPLEDNSLYYVYFNDASGNLMWRKGMADLYENIFVCTIYWNGTDGAISYECHNHTRNIAWHINAHLTIGARYYAGLSLTKPNKTDDDEIDITSGVIFDEDIAIEIPNVLSSRIFYLNADGDYTWYDSDLPYPDDNTDGTGLPAYNDAGILKSISTNDYTSVWVYATSDVDRPLYLFPSLESVNKITEAEAMQPPDLASSGLTPEMRLIYRFIYNGNGSFESADDYRFASSLPSGAISSLIASSIVFTPYGLITATDVQGAIEELEDRITALENP